MPDRIERSVELRAPPERVWQALTDHEAFGSWFQVRLDGPFRTAEAATGRFTMAGYEHVPFRAEVTGMEPMRRFAWRWHPYAVDPEVDYGEEPTTLVEFTLEPISGGTRLTVVESGFDALPPGRRPDAFRMNSEGWAQQVSNIQDHVEARAGA